MNATDYRDLALEDLAGELAAREAELVSVREQRSVALAMLRSAVGVVRRLRERNGRLIDETRALREALFDLDGKRPAA